MNKILFYLVLIFALFGCATNEKKESFVPVEVKVPIVTTVEPSRVEETEVLPISLLTSESTDEEVAEAYVKTVEALLKDLEMYREALNPFKRKNEVMKVIEFLLEKKGLPPKPKAADIRSGQKFKIIVLGDRFEIEVLNVSKPRSPEIADDDIKITYTVTVNGEKISKPMIEPYPRFIQTWWS